MCRATMTCRLSVDSSATMVWHGVLTTRTDDVYMLSGATRLLLPAAGDGAAIICAYEGLYSHEMKKLEKISGRWDPWSTQPLPTAGRRRQYPSASLAPAARESKGYWLPTHTLLCTN